MDPNGFLIIGKIVGVHGVRGTIKVYSYAESFSIFDSLRLIQIKAPTGKEKQYAIEWAKPHSRTILLSLEGINDREQAEALIGSKLLIEKTHLAELDQGEYYWFEIIGLSVFTSDDRYLGRVESIIPTRGNDVYVVQNRAESKSREILIPALESVVLQIDTQNRTMRVDLPEGIEQGAGEP